MLSVLTLLLLSESVVMGATRFRSETQRMTVVEGQRMDLVCQSELEAKSCAFKPPFGTAFAVLATEEDVSYDDGRILPHSSRKEECGIRIQNVQSKDQGEWKCYFGVDMSGEFVLGQGVFELSLSGDDDSQSQQQSALDVQFRPEVTIKEQVFPDLREGQSETISMKFTSSSRPRSGFWSVGDSAITFGEERGIFKSSEILNGPSSGDYSVNLTIKKMTTELAGKTHKLIVLTDGGSTTYKFKLELSKVVIEKPVFNSAMRMQNVPFSIIFITLLISRFC